MSPYDLYLFDFDGTLCATHEAIAHVMALTFAERGVAAPPEEEIARTIGMGIGLAETIALFHPTLSPTDTGAWIETYRRIYNSGEGQARTRLFEGAREAMEALSQAGKTMVLVSNKGERAVLSALSHFGLLGYIDRVVCDTGGVSKKPAADVYHKLVRPHYPDIPPDRILVVGDTEADVQFARNIGAAACWASYGYGARPRCLALAPDHIIADPGELLALERLRARSPFRFVADLRDQRSPTRDRAHLIGLLADLSRSGVTPAIAQRLVEQMTRHLLEAEFRASPAGGGAPGPGAEACLGRPADLVLVPILRAGLAMWTEANAYFGRPESAFVLCAKDKPSRRVEVHWASPPCFAGRTVLLLDTVVATGDTVAAVCRDIRAASPEGTRVHLVSCYVSPEAIAALSDAPLDAMTIGLISHTVDGGFLVPRINGDAGDKLFGVKPAAPPAGGAA